MIALTIVLFPEGWKKGLIFSYSLTGHGPTCLLGKMWRDGNKTIWAIWGYEAGCDARKRERRRENTYKCMHFCLKTCQ
jgi:hypothetical protein